MLNIPTTSELRVSIQNDLEAELGVQISTIGRVFIRALAGVQAAKLRLFYLAVAFIQKNVFADTADPESRGGTLERFGRVKLNRNPFPAVGAQYEVDVTGIVGSTIPAQTIFKSNDESLNPSYLFQLDAAFILTSSTDTIILRALTTGLESSLEVSDGLTATAPISGVEREGVVTGISVQPQDAESTNTYREKVVDAYRLEPQGGSAADYRLWSADVQGVKKVYSYATSGATNEVDLFIEADDDVSFPVGSGIPTATMISDVVDVVEFDPDTSRPLNERGRRPTQVIINPYPITPLDIDIEITGFTGDSGNETSVISALTDYVNTIRPFVSGADVLADAKDIISLNGVIFVIQDAVQGVNWTGLELQVSSSIVSDFQFFEGDIPKVNSITFV